MRPSSRLPAVALLLALGLLLPLAGCNSLDPGPSPEQVRATLLRKLPATLHDREGWASDIQTAFTAQHLPPSDANLCAVLAVIEQESTYRADPPVANLGPIAIAEIKRRAAARHVPAFAVDAALRMRSPDGRSYGERLRGLRTERELSELFEQMTARLPMGSGRLLAGLMEESDGLPEVTPRGFADPCCSRSTRLRANTPQRSGKMIDLSLPGFQIR